MSSDVHQIPGTKFTLTGRFLLDHDKYERRKRTDYIVVHCADTKAPADQNIGAAEIRKWHTQERGWEDIGYHFVIRRTGDIERGRPAWAVGAGVMGHNSNTLHICLVGGGDGVDDFTQDQKDSLLFLINTLHAAGRYSAAAVCGHRDFPGVDKQCPSFNAGTWFTNETLETSNLLVA
jgi:N-acetylmuramoyl-L-alanine amidase